MSVTSFSPLERRSSWWPDAFGLEGREETFVESLMVMFSFWSSLVAYLEMNAGLSLRSVSVLAIWED